MEESSIRRAVVMLLALAVVFPLSALPARAKPRLFQVVLHLRHADGREEAVEASDFRFIYYDRRFVRHSTGFGKPADLEIRDLLRELRSFQNEDLTKLKFGKLRRAVLEYREELGKHYLHLVSIRTSKHRKPVDWPANLLRNATVARLPHFRAVVGGVTTDFPLPPILEPPGRTDTVLTQIDFQDPAMGRLP